MIIITLKDIISLIWIIAVLIFTICLVISEKLNNRKNKKKSTKELKELNDKE